MLARRASAAADPASATRSSRLLSRTVSCLRFIASAGFVFSTMVKINLLKTLGKTMSMTLMSCAWS